MPKGFQVKTNACVFNDEGKQIAEFDIEIRGKVGSTNIAWLIECRDRLSQGTAPASWIEQLVGRRSRFGFNKVTAVSTTGFSDGAAEFARTAGIEIREVKELSPDEFSSWLQLRELSFSNRMAMLDHASIEIDSTTDDARQKALMDKFGEINGESRILRSLKTGKLSTLSMAFLGAVLHVGNLFDDVNPNGKGKKIELNVNYSNKDDRFVIDTSLGEVHIIRVKFIGTLSVIERLVSLNVTAEYRNVESGEVISQVAAFEPFEIEGSKVSLEMHKLIETGETYIMLQKPKE